MPKQYISTSNKCLFMYCKHESSKIKTYRFITRKRPQIKKIKQPYFKMSENLAIMKQSDWDATKDFIDAKIIEWRHVEKKEYKKPQYCLHKQLITRKEKKMFEERNEIQRQYSRGMGFQSMLEYFGPKRKKYIKRVILEESQQKEDDPGVIRTYRTTKLKLAQKNYIDELLSDPNYLGGLRDTVERLKYHSNPNIAVDVCEATVRKYLNRNYVMKNLVNEYRLWSLVMQVSFSNLLAA